jgi:hypothetical protein
VSFDTFKEKEQKKERKLTRWMRIGLLASSRLVDEASPVAKLGAIDGVDLVQVKKIALHHSNCQSSRGVKVDSLYPCSQGSQSLTLVATLVALGKVDQTVISSNK